jgi:putative ABC transport system permease protein
VLLAFIGTLTLGIGGVGVMNIMLVSVDERVREIGLRRALGARRWHIQAQFLSEALVLTLAGGAFGIGLAALITAYSGTLPMLGPLFKDTSGKGDIHLALSPATAALSTAILVLVGVLSGLAPAIRASRLPPHRRPALRIARREKRIGPRTLPLRERPTRLLQRFPKHLLPLCRI